MQTAKRIPSVYQQAIFDNVARGKGNTVIEAVAGLGKTTTIMDALELIPRHQTVALFAFSKTTARELAARAPRHVEVKTLHAHGFSACKRAFRLGKDAMNDDKSEILARKMFGEAIKNHPVRGYYRAMKNLLDKAKDTLVKRGDVEALDELIDRFGIDCPPEDLPELRMCQLCNEIDPEESKCPKASDDEHVFPDASERSRLMMDEYGFEDPRSPRRMFVEAAMAVLKESAKCTTMIDYADMCWLPVVLKLRPWAYDRVFVDETQDLSPSQIELLLMCCKRGGRICVVGDSRQAIYAFRGADENTIPALIDRLKATVLPLSVTYRCCRAVVKLAATEVPQFEAAPHAIEGHVSSTTSDVMLTSAQPGDMIVSRANAPLMGYCLKLLTAGKRAAIRGKEIGEGIIQLIRRAETDSVPEMLAWCKAWRDQEVERLMSLERDTEPVQDRFECVVALSEGHTSVEAVVTRARRLFVGDESSTGDEITLGTTHKLKGLEADRVWMLEDTYRRDFGGEEANCWYVAVTRAKASLFLTRKSLTATVAMAS